MCREKRQSFHCEGCNRNKDLMGFLKPDELWAKCWELECSLCLLRQYICNVPDKGRVEEKDVVKIYSAFLDEQERAEKWRFVATALGIILVALLAMRCWNA